MSGRELRNPVRVAVDDYRTQTDPTRRFDALVLAFERLVRLDAIVMASAFVHEERCQDEKVRALLLGHGLALGQWVALLRALTLRLPHGTYDELRAWTRQVGLRCPPGRPSWPTRSPCKGNALDTLMFLRNRRAHGEDRTSEEFIRTGLKVAQCCMDRCIDEHPGLPVFSVDENGTVLAESDGNAQRCDPLLLPGDLVGSPDDVLIYAGAETRYLAYETILGKLYTSPEARQILLERIGTRLSAFEPIDASVPDYVVGQRLLDVTLGTVRRAEDLRRYRSETMIARDGPDLAFQAFLEGDEALLLVDGPPGAGKTSWLAALAEERVARGTPILFAAADRLPHLRFPECLGDVLRVQGDFSAILERLSVTSADGRTVVAIDDLGSAGGETEALSTLFAWIERLGDDTPLRVVVSLRPELLHNRSSGGGGEPSSRCGRYSIPPLDGRELLDLAGRLSSAPDDEDGVVQARREAAGRLADAHGSSLRRPGVAVPILEAIGHGDVPHLYSAPDVYEHLVKRVVLEIDDSGMPRFPVRGQIVRLLASAMVKARATSLPIDAPGIQLLIDDAGRRTPPYQELLALHVLAETLSDEYVPIVSFSDPRFFEFLASLGLDGPAITALVAGADQYQSSLDVAAFALPRIMRSTSARAAWACASAAPRPGDLVFKLASIDGDCFIALVDLLVKADPALALATLARLIDDGEPKLGVRAASRILAGAVDASVAVEAHFLCSRGFFELDEYSRAVQELSVPGVDGSVRGLLLLGDVEVSRDAFDVAMTAYDAAADMAGASAQRAHGLRGRGYCLLRTDHADLALQPLREAIALLEPDESRQMAEALGDMGELLCKLREFEEAQALLERSLRINRRLGSLPGVGVVLGLLSSVDIGKKRLRAARLRIDEAEAIAHRTGNRWRQAWILDLRASLAVAEGRSEMAEKLTADARRAFAVLASSPPAGLPPWH